jgi:hypothetical protein
VAEVIKAFRSDRELRRFFLDDLGVSFFSSGGGEAPMVLSLDDCVCELEGRSSNVPKIVGLSRDIGRLGESMDLDLPREPFDRLEFICSPVAVFRDDLLSVRHTEGRGSESPLWLFCRSSVSANLFRSEDVFDVRDPAVE